MRIRRSSAALLMAIAAAALTMASQASAATFTSTPPAIVAAGSGPLTWAFQSDAPGTSWGRVTWKLSTEPEWHMCGGPSGTVTLEAPAPGTYWVEIADEVDLAFAAESLHLPPFDRCSEPHSPALGPLHPVTLAATVVLEPTTPALEPTAPPSPSATTTVLVSPGPKSAEASARCQAQHARWKRTRADIRADRRHLLNSSTATERARARHHLIADRSELRELHRAC